MLLSTPEAGFDLTQHVVQSIGVPLHNPNKTSKYNWVVFVVLQRDAKERFLECHTVIRPNNPKLNCLTRVLKATGQKSHSSLAHFPFLQMSAHTIFFFFFGPFFNLCSHSYVCIPVSSILYAHQSWRYSSSFISGKKILFYLWKLLLFHLLVFLYYSFIFMAFSPDAGIARFLCSAFPVICSFPLGCELGLGSG